MAEIKYAKSYVITNKLKAVETQDTVWNTGLCACGNPHIDEDVANSGKSTISDSTEIFPKINKSQVSVAIYGNKNQFVTLNPGDKITVNAETDEAAQFYLAQAVEGVVEVKDASAVAASVSETPEDTGVSQTSETPIEDNPEASV